VDEGYGRAYRQLYERHWWWRVREELVVATLDDLLPRDGSASILDIGCGDGLLFDRLTVYGDVEGIEADARLVTRGGRWEHHIHVRELDERFEPGKRYSAILMLDVVEHISDPRRVLRRACELLAPGGWLVLTVPAFLALWTRLDDLNHHQTRYTTGTLLPLVREAGLDVVRARYFFQWLFAAKLLVRAIERLRPGSPAVPQVPRPLVNRLLQRVTRAEQAVARTLPFPFGSSLLVVARKR
jgi:2-polyprenyl-3-methyl-5-hydroxy-6-metoxy-1,4-benzoquinol methylase